MSDDGRTREEVAALLRYEKRACGDCDSAGRSPSCPNCEGSGHVWVNVQSSLSDAGLDRLRTLVQAPSRKGGEP